MTSPFDLRDPDRLPNAAELNHWADYVELRCLSNSDYITSSDELLAQLRLGKDLGEGTVAGTQGDDVEIDPEDLDRLLGVPDDEVSGLDEEPGWGQDLDGQPTADDEGRRPDSERRDSDARRIGDIWAHLRYRSEAFQDVWPFEIDAAGRSIRVCENLTEIHQRYIFLLMCSSLRYVKPQRQSQLTQTFERFCLDVFLAAFPGWEVHIFGTTSPEGGHYSGGLWSKVQQLALDIRAPLIIKEDQLHPGESGDNGLDLVAWLPLPDHSKGLPFAFAQCASGMSNWKSKQSEAGEDRWSQALTLATPVQNWTMIPFCYHTPRGDWESPHEVARGVLMDRLRMVSLLGDELIHAEVLEADPVIAHPRVGPSDS